MRESSIQGGMMSEHAESREHAARRSTTAGSLGLLLSIVSLLLVDYCRQLPHGGPCYHDPWVMVVRTITVLVVITGLVLSIASVVAGFVTVRLMPVALSVLAG